MSFVVTCPGCSKRLKVKDEARGGRIRCPECQEKIELDEESDEDDDDFDEPVVRKPRPSSKSSGKKSRKSKSKGNGFPLLLVGGIGAAVILLTVMGVGGYALISAFSKSSAASAAWVKHTEPNLFEIETPAPFGPDPDSVGNPSRRGFLVKHEGIEYSCVTIRGTRSPSTFDEAWRGVRFSSVMQDPKNRVTDRRYLGTGQYVQGGFEGGEIHVESQVAEDMQIWFRNDHTRLMLTMKYAKNRSDPKTERDRFFGSLKFTGGGAQTPANPAPALASTPKPAAGPAWISYQHENLFTVETPTAMQVQPLAHRVTTNLRSTNRQTIYNCAVGTAPVDIYSAPGRSQSFMDSFLQNLQSKYGMQFQEKTFLRQGKIEGVQVKAEKQGVVIYAQYWFTTAQQFVTLEMIYPAKQSDPKTERERFFGSLKFLNQ